MDWLAGLFTAGVVAQGARDVAATLERAACKQASSQSCPVGKDVPDDDEPAKAGQDVEEEEEDEDVVTIAPEILRELHVRVEDIAQRADMEKHFRALSPLTTSTPSPRVTRDSPSLSSSSSLSATTAVAPQAAPSLFDQFLVVGCAGSVAEPPSVLWSFPTGATAVWGVEHFCLGFADAGPVLWKTVDSGELLELLYSRSAARASSTGFVWTAGVAPDVRYGVCVTRWEPANWPVLREWRPEEPMMSIPDRLAACARAEGPGERYLLTQRCYCIVSSRPFLGLLFGIVNDVLDHDRYGLLSHTGEPSESLPLQPQAFSLFVAAPPFTPECYYSTTELLRRCKTVPVPKLGTSLSLQVSPHLTHIRVFDRYFETDIHEEDQRFLELYGAPSLARHFSAQTVVQLLSALLLESRLVIMSPDVREVTGTVFALLSLLRPFHWRSVAVPVLPARLAGAIEAPVPFVVGMTRVAPAQLPDQCLLGDLESGQLLAKRKQRLPLLPGSKELEDALSPPLSALAREFKDAVSPSLSGPGGREAGMLTEAQAEHWREVSKIVRRHLTATLCSSSALHRSVATFPGQSPEDHKQADPDDVPDVSVLVREVLVNATPVQDRLFMGRFSETQLFNEHFATALRVMDEREHYHRTITDVFNELI